MLKISLKKESPNISIVFQLEDNKIFLTIYDVWGYINKLMIY